MEKVKTASAVPADSDAGVDEHAQVQSLLSSASWHQRLEEARQKREKVLAEKGQSDPDAASEELHPSAATQRRPWETSPSGMSNVISALRLSQNHLIKSEAAGGEKIAKLQGEGAETGPAPETVVPPARPAESEESEASIAPVPRSHSAPPVGRAIRSQEPVGDRQMATGTVAKASRWGRVAFVAAAFAFGLGIGLGIAALISLKTMKAADGATKELQVAVALAPTQPAPPVKPVAQLQPVAQSQPATKPEEIVANARPEVPPMIADASAAPTLPGPASEAARGTDLPQPDAALSVAMAAPAPVLGMAPQASDLLPEVGETGFAPPSVGQAPVKAAAPSAETDVGPSVQTSALAEPDISPVVQELQADATRELPLTHMETVSAPAPAPKVAPAEVVAAQPGAALAGYDIRVFVPTVPNSESFAEVSTELEAAGYTVHATDRVNFTVSADHVRFYHSADRATAQAIAKMIGGPARDFTGADNVPVDGTIEVWLAGTGAVTAAPAAKTTAKTTVRTKTKAVAKAAATPAGPTEAEQAQALRAWLLYQLQTN
jgi:hypothetical protein